MSLHASCLASPSWMPVRFYLWPSGALPRAWIRPSVYWRVHVRQRDGIAGPSIRMIWTLASGLRQPISPGSRLGMPGCGWITEWMRCLLCEYQGGKWRFLACPFIDCAMAGAAAAAAEADRFEDLIFWLMLLLERAGSGHGTASSATGSPDSQRAFLLLFRVLLGCAALGFEMTDQATPNLPSRGGFRAWLRREGTTPRFEGGFPIAAEIEMMGQANGSRNRTYILDKKEWISQSEGKSSPRELVRLA
ncbi:hypothetical protein ACH68A_26170 [Klebsiella aerogenes]|uniref:hypothetical protein n=1 Tax=Klebsiella aerogenes TaxID=548 RepID=UPI0037BB4C50